MRENKRQTRRATGRRAADTLPDLDASPLYLLAVVYSARRSGDRVLERVTQKKLESLGIHVSFGTATA